MVVVGPPSVSLLCEGCPLCCAMRCFTLGSCGVGAVVPIRNNLQGFVTCDLGEAGAVPPAVGLYSFFQRTEILS